jgi:hypothetical protein
MGRKDLVEHGKISKELLENAYAACPRIPVIAQALHVAQNTVRKYAKLYGIVFKRGRPVGHHRHYGSLIQWVREHKSTPLPRSIAAIHALTGCTEDAIKAYLKRGRAQIRAYLKALPDLRKTTLRFKAKSGVVIPFRVIKRYTLHFHPWTLQITLQCALGAKVFKKVFTLKSFKRFTAVALHPLRCE